MVPAWRLKVDCRKKVSIGADLWAHRENTLRGEMSSKNAKNLEAPGGFEPPVKVLQTLALATWPRCLILFWRDVLSEKIGSLTEKPDAKTKVLRPWSKFAFR